LEAATKANGQDQDEYDHYTESYLKSYKANKKNAKRSMFSTRQGYTDNNDDPGINEADDSSIKAVIVMNIKEETYSTGNTTENY
jgi:hypothetical protein